MTTPQKQAAAAPEKTQTAGLKGRHTPGDGGVDALSGDELLAAAQAKAPSLTKEFVAAYKLSDDELRQIAVGLVPPPPTPGPVHTADLYLTPAGWQQTPPGVKPEDVGGTAIAR